MFRRWAERRRRRRIEAAIPHADANLRRRVDELEHDLARERKRVDLLKLEIEMMAGVIVRDRKRVEAELAGFVREAEGGKPQ